MGENGNRNAAALRAQLSRIERLREQVAKAWLIDVILASPLAGYITGTVVPVDGGLRRYQF